MIDQRVLLTVVCDVQGKAMSATLTAGELQGVSTHFR
jgi:hypothetical protein